MLSFNLRGINPNVMLLLKEHAEKEHLSINSLIINCIEHTVGFSHQIKKHTYHDLDHLAGTWDKKDAAAFKKQTQYFEKIDTDLWS